MAKATYPFTLQPYTGPGSRYTCPQCGCKKVFTRYINTATGMHLAHHVGRCSREVKCGYHFKPRHYFSLNPQAHTPALSRPVLPPAPPPPPSYTPLAQLQQTLGNYPHNAFAQYLLALLGHSVTQQLIARYHIGTGTRWPGSTVFWQVDVQGRIRGGKVILYHAQTGKRVKQPYPHIAWMHRPQSGYHLQQCLFGEHLLPQHPHLPVALVESEKTAIIASAYLPQYVWLAVGSLSSLNAQKCQPLYGRTVVLHPDLNGYQLWQQKADELRAHMAVKVSAMLQNLAAPTEKAAGYDLADYLVTQPLHAFAGLHPPPPAPEYTLADMEHYFARLSTLPQGTVQLKPYLSVTNLPEQVANWLKCCRLYQGKKIYGMYFNHLLQVRQWIEAGMPQAEPVKPFRLEVSR